MANVRLTFLCPFCGRQAGVVKPDGVMHAEPACERFIALDVVEYLAAVNRAFERGAA